MPKHIFHSSDSYPIPPLVPRMSFQFSKIHKNANAKNIVRKKVKEICLKINSSQF